MYPAVFAKQNLVNLHKLCLLRRPFCNLWFHTWAQLGVAEQLSLSDESESMLEGQESVAKSSCQSAAPLLAKGQHKRLIYDSSSEG